MTDDHQRRADRWRWGIPASLLVHAVLAFFIIVGFPIELPKPEAEEVVSVEIVPPEEQDAEQPAPAAAEEEAEEKAEPQEPPATPAQTSPEQSGTAQQLDSFRQVFRFGEENSGPEVASDGNAAQEEQAPESVDKTDEEQQERAETEAENPTPEQVADAAAEAQRKVEEEAAEQGATAAAPVPDDVTIPEVGLGPAAGDVAGIPVPTPRADAVNAEIAMAPASEAETPKPSGLKSATQLFSPSATDNPMAAIAMGSMSRGERAAELCNTELREQLRHGSPAYNANVLPKPRLTGDNLIEVRSIGFRARDQWYDVSFRCEVDKDAMAVVSFSHQVGGAIPKSEWRKRGFPAY